MNAADKGFLGVAMRSGFGVMLLCCGLTPAPPGARSQAPSPTPDSGSRTATESAATLSPAAPATGPPAATARTAGGVSLREAIIRWSKNPVALQAGQFKSPFSREYLMPVPALETADFSAVVDSLAPKYEIGAMAEYVVPWFGLYAGAFNGEGQNAGLNRDSTVLAVARMSVRPLAQVTIAGHVARYSADSTRYGADLSLEHAGWLARGEVLGQRKRGRGRDDLGWYVLGAFRLRAWLQLVAKREDFQRPAIGEARRISATTGGANIELPGGRTRLLAHLVSRETGFPRARRNSLIGQVQVRF